MCIKAGKKIWYSFKVQILLSSLKYIFSSKEYEEIIFFSPYEIKFWILELQSFCFQSTKCAYSKVWIFFVFISLFDSQIAQAIAKGVDRGLFVHYIFMDNEFELPTGAGLQLKFALSGIATPGARVAAKLHQKSVSPKSCLYFFSSQ